MKLFKKYSILLSLVLSISASAQTVKTSDNDYQQMLNGSEAKHLFQALSHFIKPSQSKIEFLSLECAYQGPGAGDSCYECKNHLYKSKPCKACNELQPKYPSYCEVDSIRHAQDAHVKTLGKAMSAIKTGSDGAMGGWYSKTTRSGFCSVQKGKFHCEYAFHTP